MAGDVGTSVHYLQKYFEELENIISTCNMASVNVLRMFYDRLPRKKIMWKEKIQTLDIIKKELDSLTTHSAQLLKAKEIINSVLLLAHQYSQDPVKAYLESRQSIILQIS
jgi:hypothetical protein